MTPEFVIQIIREALMTAFWLSAPLLAVGFIAGIVISLVQIVTSIQDSAFSTIPRLAVFLGAFIISLPWMLQKMTAYTVQILSETSAGMGGSLVLTTSTLLGFLLTLARVAGAFVFVPMPGLKSGFDLARTVLTVCITVALFAQWPQVPADTPIGIVAAWLIAEAGLGIGIGLAVGFVTEAFGVGAQIMGLQAGYAYASTIDPNTQADSGILVIFAQLASGLLFFTLGLDREVLRILAHSMEVAPPGSIFLSQGAGEHLLSLGSTMFSTGLRLALPVVAVLVMVDVSLALLGRINSQLQLLTVAFPIKMMVGLFVLGWVALLLPTLFLSDAAVTLGAVKALAGR